MANKNNIRSIRFSDELAELIDRQVGRTFTEKFENLVTRCVWELPKKIWNLRKSGHKSPRSNSGSGSWSKNGSTSSGLYPGWTKL